MDMNEMIIFKIFSFIVLPYAAVGLEQRYRSSDKIRNKSLTIVNHLSI